MPLPACRCSQYKTVDIDEFRVDSPVLRFEQVQRRGPPHWWLAISRCADCGTYWMVAQEERLNDVYMLKRLDDDEKKAVDAGNWPPVFDKYEDLLRIAKDYGHAMRYADPAEALPICIDLLGQNPSIDEATVRHLVNVSPAEASLLLARARQAITTKGYPYPWTERPGG